MSAAVATGEGRGDVRIGRLDPGRLDEAARVLTAALIDEPGFASIYPDVAVRRPVMERLMAMPARDALRFRTVWAATIGDEIAGVAVWLPPGAFPPSFGRSLHLLPALLPLVRYGPGAFVRLMRMGANAQRHFPDEPSWYLEILGVAPGHQGRGIGSRLIAPALAQADAMGAPAYLETGEERNLGFYERFGFRVREAAVQLAPTPGPTHWTMQRPRGS